MQGYRLSLRLMVCSNHVSDLHRVRDIIVSLAYVTERESEVQSL